MKSQGYKTPMKNNTDNANSVFKARITVRDVIQIVVFLAALFSAYFMLGNRVTVLENIAASRGELLKTVVTEKEHRLTLSAIEIQLREINRRLDGIDKKLD